jgi:HEAT repeat protein
MMGQIIQQSISTLPERQIDEVDKIDEATLLLAQLDIEETVRNLLALLEDQNSNVRSRAMTALYQLSTNDMVLALLRREESIHMLKQYFTDRIRKQSAYGYYYSDRSPELLARVKSDEAIGLLLEFLQKSATDIQSRAIMALYQVSNHREGIRILRSHKKTGFLITFLKEQFQEQFKDQLKKQTSLYYQTQQYGYSDQLSYIKELLNRIDRTEILNVFVDLLKEPNRDIRINAAAGLGQLRDYDVIDPLVELLNDPDAVVRRNTVTILVQLGSDKTIIPLIEILSNDPDGTVRRSAAMALGQLGSEKAVEPLVSALNDPDETVRRSATMALGQLGNDKAVEPLVELLKDRDPIVRMNVAAILGKFENRKGVAPLIELLKDPEPNVVGTAIGALLALTTDEEVLETLRNEYTVNLLGKILKELEEFSPNSTTIIELLVKIDTRGAVNILVEMLKDPDVFWRYDIENALPRFNSQAVIGALATLLNHEYPEVRSSVASVLGQIDSDEVDRFLIEALKDRDANVRLSVVLALSQLGRKEAIEPLIELLGDRHQYVGAVLELGQIGSGETVESLLVFLKARDQFIQPKAIKILAQLASNEAIEPLLELLSDQNTATVNQAVAALCCLNTSNLVEPALRLLQAQGYYPNVPSMPPFLDVLEGEDDPHACILYSAINSTAASTLGYLGSRKAVKSLLELLQKRIQYLRLTPSLLLPYLSFPQYPVSLPSSPSYPVSLPPSPSYPQYSSPSAQFYRSVWAVATETLGHLNSHEAIDLLIELLEVQDLELQRSAVVALGKLSVREAIEPLKRLYVQKSQPLNRKPKPWPYENETTMETQIQLTLAAVLLGFEHQDGWKFLQEKSLSENVIERQELAKILGENPSDKGIELLLTMLDDKDKTVRRQVIASLGRAQAVRALPYLHDLVGDFSPKIRRAAVNALGDIASPESVAILTQIALNPEERIFIRIAAIEGLGKINIEESVSALLEMLGTTDKHYHYKSIIELGKTRSQKALPILLDYLENLRAKRMDWRRIREESTEGYTDEQRMDWYMRLRKVSPKTSLEFELAHAIAQIEPDGEGVKLLSHDLAKVREGAWMGLAKLPLTETRPFYLIDGPAAVKRLERLDRERIQSKNPLFRHAAYRAIDGMLISIETYGRKPALDALEAFLSKVQDQEGVLTRVEWTIARLQEQEEKD